MSAIPLSQVAEASGFTAVLPAIVNHARIRFGRLRPEAREEAIAEMVAAAYQNYHRLQAQRQVGSRQNSRDALSPLAARRHGFALSSLPAEAEDSAASWRLLARADARVSPADQAAFNLDFRAWLKSRSRRERKIIHCLASGEGTLSAADRFGLTPGRMSQLRRIFERSWASYQGPLQ